MAKVLNIDYSRIRATTEAQAAKRVLRFRGKASLLKLVMDATKSAVDIEDVLRAGRATLEARGVFHTDDEWQIIKTEMKYQYIVNK